MSECIHTYFETEECSGDALQCSDIAGLFVYDTHIDTKTSKSIFI